MDNKKKDELKKAFQTVLSKVATSQTRRTTPLFVDDVITFHVDEDTDLEKWCENVGARDKIGAYRMINSVEGHRISASQLTRTGNGIPFTGATKDECLLEFFMWCLEGDVKLKVVDSKIQETTRRNGDNERILKFEKL